MDGTLPLDCLDLDASSLSEALHTRRLSCRELMQATLQRIERDNPRFNAIVNLASPESLLAQADERDRELARGQSRGWMHGMPQAIKDLAHAEGFPTTLGSPLLKQAYPAQDSLMVRRMKDAGCIVIGKTNTPELGLGSNTYNTLFGRTGNAWDPSRTAGGSSGGAAVALSRRYLPVADGSDFMGSLRNPAGWNHVFGLRPSPGRVPAWPKPEVWVSQLGTEGPMARTVRDLARLLDTQSGHDPRAPLSLDDATGSFVPGPRCSLSSKRVAWLGDLDGYLPMEPGILEACEAALGRMSHAGAQVEPVSLGFDAHRIWQAWIVWRRALASSSVAALLQLPGARAQIKPEALWEYDTAQGLAFGEFMSASALRTAFLQHLLSRFGDFDVLALPTAQTWPFDGQVHWPREVAGRAMDTYHRWMEVTIYATFAGLPAMSVPAGFDPSGRLPTGLQLIGKPRGEKALLEVAAAYEATIPDLLARRPPGANPTTEPRPSPAA